MEKLIETIEKLTKEELAELKNKIRKGDFEMLVDERLERFKNQNKVCPVCNTQINEDSLTLFFGPQGFRKKATFDGLDCLEYFISKLKE